MKHGLENVGLSTRTHITLMIQRPEIMWRTVYTFWGKNCRSQDSTYVCKQWAPTWRFHSASCMKIAREFTCSPNIVSTTRIKSHCDTLLSLRIRIRIEIIISFLSTSLENKVLLLHPKSSRRWRYNFYSSYPGLQLFNCKLCVPVNWNLWKWKGFKLVHHQVFYTALHFS